MCGETVARGQSAVVLASIVIQGGKVSGTAAVLHALLRDSFRGSHLEIRCSLDCP